MKISFNRRIASVRQSVLAFEMLVRNDLIITFSR